MINILSISYVLMLRRMSFWAQTAWLCVSSEDQSSFSECKIWTHRWYECSQLKNTLCETFKCCDKKALIWSKFIFWSQSCFRKAKSFRYHQTICSTFIFRGSLSMEYFHLIRQSYLVKQALINKVRQRLTKSKPLAALPKVKQQRVFLSMP